MAEELFMVCITRKMPLILSLENTISCSAESRMASDWSRS